MILLFMFACASSFAAEAENPVLRAWTKETTGSEKSGEQSVKIRATYYSNEYVEALIMAEAEKNLWTNDEMENYKYTLLKNLNLGDSIPVHIDITVQGMPVYAGPFNKHISMRVGKNKYEPVDYDKRLDFRLQGQRDGSSVTSALSARGDVLWVWDLTKDRGQIGGGKAATRLEIDRLLKRSENLDEQRAALQKQIDALTKEYNDVNSRIDELQAQ